MNLLLKPFGAAALGLAIAAVSFSAPASAGSRGDVAAGVIGGVIVGGLIAGAANARPAPPPVYYSAPPRSDCGELRRRARYNESIGRYDRADYWRDQYRACRG